jgi:hypothetical protein
MWLCFGKPVLILRPIPEDWSSDIISSAVESTFHARNMYLYLRNEIQMRQFTLASDRYIETMFRLQDPHFISRKRKEALAAARMKSRGLLRVMTRRLVNIYVTLRRSLHHPAFLGLCPTRRSIFINGRDITSHKIWILNFKPILYLTHKSAQLHYKK